MTRLNIFLCIGLVFVGALNLFSQANLGSIQGTVNDESGAIIPSVKVTAREVSKGVEYSSTSDSAGLFLIGQLPPGNYEVTAEVAGFQKFLQRNVTTTVDSHVHLSIVMKVGQVTQTIEVTSQPTALQTDDNAIKKVVTETMVVDLPLNGRSSVSLVMLSPGTQETTVSNGTSSDSEPRLSGGRTRLAEFSLDGTSITDPRRGSTIFLPNPDAIQEFDVMTTGIPAEYGRLVGGIVNVALRTGTNQFHGDAFEFLRNNHLNARNFFAATVPTTIYNQFGGIVGGPIKRNRIWFFGDYQATRNVAPTLSNLTIPTAAEVQGNFSAILGTSQKALDALGRPVYQNEIFNPTTLRTAPNGQLVDDPFPGNIISSGFDPAGLKVAQLYPAPNENLTGFASNFYAQSPGHSHDDTFDARGDARLTDKDTFFIRFSGDRTISIGVRAFPEASGSLGSTTDFYTGAINWTHTMNPTTVNDVHIGVLRGVGQTLLPGTNFSSLGIPNLPQVNVPQFLVSGYNSLGDAQVFNPTQMEYQLEDALTVVRGRHILKFGADFRRFNVNDLQDSYNGEYWLYANQTASPASGTTGNAVASLELGAAQEYSNDLNNLIEGRFYQRSDYFGTFVQDQFKVNKDFTLSLGLRWDVEQQPNEIRWSGSNFDLLLGQVESMRALGTNRIQLTQMHNFSPRVGFVWQPWGSKTVVRSSYGTFYGPLTGRATSAFDRWPRSNILTLSSAGVAPAVIISQTPPTVASPQGYNQTHYHDNVEEPVLSFQQWNLDLEREIKGNILLEASYVGSVGDHLQANIQYNEIPIGVVQQNGGGTQSMRPYPNFGTIGQFCACQRSTYNALELSATRRFSNGLTFLASYAFSKFIDFQDDNFSSLEPESSYYPRLEKGLSLANIPNIFHFTGVYQLPWGPGRAYLNSGLVSKIVGGWEASGILTLQSGQVTWIQDSVNTAQTFSLAFRPNLIGNPVLPKDQRTLAKWFNTSAFVAPAPLTLGTSNKTPGLYGPGWVNLDFGLHRSIHLPLTDSTRIEIRAEAFNIFNRANFQPPEAAFGTGTFGQVTSAQAGRVVQFGAKLWF